MNLRLVLFTILQTVIASKIAEASAAKATKHDHPFFRLKTAPQQSTAFFPSAGIFIVQVHIFCLKEPKNSSETAEFGQTSKKTLAIFINMY